MFEKIAGIYTQLQELKKSLKKLTPSKDPKGYKETLDAIETAEAHYEKAKKKKEERKKLKEKENEKTPEESKETPKEIVETSESVPVNKESADVLPETETDWSKILEPKREYKPMDPTVKKEVVKNVEKKLGPAIISFKQDDVVKPARGSESLGRVIRCDASEENPAGLVYVFWDSGPLKDRDVAGGYYQADLVKHSVEEVKPKEEPKCPCYEDQSVYCPKCKSQKTSDLKSNYEEMLKDLKEEREAHYNQGNHAWVTRLDQKIQELENTIKEKFGKEAEVIDHPSGTNRLTVIDQTPSSDKANYGSDGKPSESEYQDMWANPNGRNLNAKNKCAICEKEFDSWLEYDEHRKKHLKQPAKTSSKINVFNRDWNVTPVKKDASIGYEISDNMGKKVMHIKPANGKEWSEAELQAALKHELTQGFKQAKLTTKIAFLPEGTKVVLLATSKDKKQTKFASIQHGVRGWTATSNLKLLALDGQSVAHEGHQDKVLAIHETESLIECPIKGVHWEKKEAVLPTHDKSTSQPPATPESLHEEAAPKVEDSTVIMPKKEFVEEHEKLVKELKPIVEEHKEQSEELKEVKESAKDCPDCHGTFVGKEDEKCPTCGRFSVDKQSSLGWVCKDCNETFIDYKEAKSHTFGKGHNVVEKTEKEALKQQIIPKLPQALPPVLPNERAHVSAGLNKKASSCAICGTSFSSFEEFLKHKKEKHSHPKPVACSECAHRFETISDVEKHKDIEHKVASLNKQARVVHQKDGWHVLSEKGKNLGGPYGSKEEAVKRLRQVEYFKHQGSQRPFSKKEAAEVLIDPYQTLTEQVSNMRSRMDAVKERLSSNPLPKQAEEGKESFNVPELIDDLEMGVELLETKLGMGKDGDEDVSPEVHSAVEELENLLWKIESELGLKVDLPERAYEEPEHKEVIKELEEKEVEKESSTEVKADSLQTPPPGNPPAGMKWAWEPNGMKWILVAVGASGGSSYGM